MDAAQAAESKAVFVDGRRWLVCPVAGPDCFRVLADLGSIAVDAVEFHAENHHVGERCSCCGR